MRRLSALAVALLALAMGVCAARAETRVALVIGNAAYVHAGPLGNTLNDADDVSAALKSLGFSTIDARNTDRRALDAAIKSFSDRLAGADVALLFYAGHGLQVGAQNYLMPVDAKLERERDLEFEAVKLDFVLRQMELEREGKTNIVLLDACRDNPLARNLARSMGTRSASIGRGLAQVQSGLGTFVAYATQPGNVALDGEGSRNSPFTTSLLRHMRVQGRNLPATMIAIRNDVVAATNGRQVPWDHSSLTREFYFLPEGVAAPASAAGSSGSGGDLAALQERLRKLEEAQKRDASQPTSGTFVVTPGRRAVGDVLSAPPSTANCETRCQTQSNCLAWNLSRGGMCELLSRVAQVVDDVEWRFGVKPGALPAPTERAKAPPVQPKASRTPATDLTLDDNVRIEGNVMAQSREPNPEACRALCQATAGCIGWQHGRRAPMMGQCHLFDRLDGRQQDASWRSGVRTADARPPPRQQLAPNPTDGRTLDCHPIGLAFKEPIPIKEGLKLCNGIGQHEARVIGISARAVHFSVKGGPEFGCKPGDVCQFDWPGAPSPYFSVRIAEGSDGRVTGAVIVPRGK